MNHWRSSSLLFLLIEACTPLRDGPLVDPVTNEDVPQRFDDRGATGSDVVIPPDETETVDAPATRSCPADMVLIPAATFQMGSSLTGSMPVHAVSLTAYCIDRTEVTVAAYRACVGCLAAGAGAGCNGDAAGRTTHPINCVRYFDAEAYCQSVGRHLPTEAQWEYAARGPEGRLFPWGSEAPSIQACWRQATTCAVGSHREGDSSFGVSDLAGNVAEWTADWFGEYRGGGTVQDNPTGATSGSERVTRGGHWATTSSFPNALQTTARTSMPPDTSSPRLGFRCAL